MTKKIKIYMAGPLFNRNDRFIRKQDVECLQHESQKYNVELDIFAPIDATFNFIQDGSKIIKTYNIVIFDNDNKYLDNADVVIVDIDTHDAGTMVELGRCCAANLWKNPAPKIYVLWTNELCGDDFKNCINRYILGAINSCCTWVKSIPEVFNHIINDFNLEVK